MTTRSQVLLLNSELQVVFVDLIGTKNQIILELPWSHHSQSSELLMCAYHYSHGITDILSEKGSHLSLYKGYLKK